MLAATKRDSLDNGVKLLAVLGQALPGFWVAVMLVLLLSVKFRLLRWRDGTLKHYVRLAPWSFHVAGDDALYDQVCWMYLIQSI